MVNFIGFIKEIDFIGSGGGAPLPPIIPVPAQPMLYKACMDGDSLSSSQIWSVTSTSKGRRLTGYWPNAAALTYQIFDVNYTNGFGLSGANIDGIYDSRQEVIDYIASNNVEALFVHLGTNDVEYVSKSVSYLKQKYREYLNDFTNVRVFLGIPFPRGDWESDTAPDRAIFVQRLHDIRDSLIDVAGEFSNVFVWDSWSKLVNNSITDPTTGLKYFPLDGTMSSDGVHLSGIGAHIAGTDCADLIKSTDFWSDPTALPNAVGNYLPNPSLTGTSGSVSTGATGVVANNCRLQRGSGSSVVAVGSKETISINGVSQVTQKMVISGATAINEEIYFYAEYPEVNTTFNGSEGIEFIVPLKIRNAVGMRACYLSGRVDVSSTSYTTRDMVAITGMSLPNIVEEDWLLKTEPLRVPAGTSTRHQILVRVVVNGSIPSSGVTINIGNPVLRKKAI